MEWNIQWIIISVYIESYASTIAVLIRNSNLYLLCFSFFFIWPSVLFTSILIRLFLSYMGEWLRYRGWVYDRHWTLIRYAWIAKQRLTNWLMSNSPNHVQRALGTASWPSDEHRANAEYFCVSINNDETVYRNTSVYHATSNKTLITYFCFMILKMGYELYFRFCGDNKMCKYSEKNRKMMAQLMIIYKLDNRESKQNLLVDLHSRVFYQREIIKWHLHLLNC